VLFLVFTPEGGGEVSIGVDSPQEKKKGSPQFGFGVWGSSHLVRADCGGFEFWGGLGHRKHTPLFLPPFGFGFFYVSPKNLFGGRIKLGPSLWGKKCKTYVAKITSLSATAELNRG